MENRFTSEQIIRSIEEEKERLEEFTVRKIGLFGSFLRGKPKKNSDLDFIVGFRKPSFDNYMDLKFMLQRMFGRRVDLVTDSALKPALRHIKDEALYARL
jgi:predicted nucleotidyltransferase